MAAAIVERLQDRALDAALEAFVARSSDAVIITDADVASPDGPVILYINPAGVALGGWTDADALIGARYAKLVPPDRFPHVLAQVREAAATGHPVSDQRVVEDVAGHQTWVEVVHCIDLGSADGARWMFHVVRDITRRQRAEFERETTLRLFASVMGAIDQILAVVDESGRFAFVDAAFTRAFGWSSPSLDGKTLPGLVRAADAATIEAHLRIHATTRPAWRLKTAIRHAEGQPVPAAISAITVEDDDRLRHVVTVELERPADLSLSPQFEAAVRQALLGRGEDGFVVAGKLQLIELTAVREALGERWPAVAERSFDIAERILKSHLAPADVYCPTGDRGFLVCFSALAEEPARFKAHAISREIRARLTGEIPEIETTHVRSTVMTVPAAAIAAQPDRPLGDLLGEQLTRESRRLEVAARQTVQQGFSPASVVFEPVRSIIPGKSPPLKLVLAHPPPDIRAALRSLETLGTDRLDVEAEMVVLAGCGTRILGQLDGDRTEFLVASVRAETLLHRREAERWLQVARSLAGPARQRIAAEIVDVPPSLARQRLADLVIMLSSVFRMVAIELTVTDTAAVHAIPLGVTLATLPVARLGSETDQSFILAAARVARLLAARHCSLLVKGVVTPLQSASLVKAGISMISTD